MATYRVRMPMTPEKHYRDTIQSMRPTSDRIHSIKSIKPWKQRLYSNWLKFCERTTMHGFKEFLFNDHINLKIGWAILVFIMFVVMTEALQLAISQFSTISRSSFVHFSKPESFPNVTFCPRHWIDTKKCKNELNMTDNVLHFAQLLAWPSFTVMWNFPEARQFDLNKMRSEYRDYQQRMNISSLEQLYLSMAFDNVFTWKTLVRSVTRIVRSHSVCYLVEFENDFRLIYSESVLSFEYQMNVTVNMNRTRSLLSLDQPLETNAMLERTQNKHDDSDIPSAPHVLYMYDKSPLAETSIQDYYGHMAGFPNNAHTILIGNDAHADQSVNVYPIQPGQSVFFRLRATKHSYAGEKKNILCKDYKDGDHLSCLLDCKKLALYATLNCSFFLGSENDMIDHCLLNDSIGRMDDVIADVKNRTVMKEIEDECFKTCLSFSPCTVWTYDPVIMPLGRLQFLDQEQPKNITFDLGALEFSYDNFESSTAVEESIDTMNPFALIGNIGGIFSFFTGASFLSFCHIIYHFILRRFIPPPEAVQQAVGTMRNSTHEVVNRVLKKKKPTVKQRVKIAAEVTVRKISRAPDRIRKMSEAAIRKVSRAAPPPMPTFDEVTEPSDTDTGSHAVTVHFNLGSRASSRSRRSSMSSDMIGAGRRQTFSGGHYEVPKDCLNIDYRSISQPCVTQVDMHLPPVPQFKPPSIHSMSRSMSRQSSSLDNIIETSRRKTVSDETHHYAVPNNCLNNIEYRSASQPCSLEQIDNIYLPPLPHFKPPPVRSISNSISSSTSRRSSSLSNSIEISRRKTLYDERQHYAVPKDNIDYPSTSQPCIEKVGLPMVLPPESLIRRPGSARFYIGS